MRGAPQLFWQLRQKAQEILQQRDLELVRLDSTIVAANACKAARQLTRSLVAHRQNPCNAFRSRNVQGIWRDIGRNLMVENASRCELI